MELSKREKKVLKLIAEEYSSKDIASILNISIRTVDTHRKNIAKKLKTKSLVGLIKYAIKEGMISGFSYSDKKKA